MPAGLVPSCRACRRVRALAPSGAGPDIWASPASWFWFPLWPIRDGSEVVAGQAIGQRAAHKGGACLDATRNDQRAPAFDALSILIELDCDQVYGKMLVRTTHRPRPLWRWPTRAAGPARRATPVFLAT